MTTEEMYGRLDERLIALTKAQSDDNKESKEIQKQTLLQVTTTNGRVTKLEIWQGWIKGALAVLIFIAGYAIKHFLG